MGHRHCGDFSRTELLRSAAERACDCMPEALPGMPTPAGSGLDRRRFLLGSAGALVAVYGASRAGLGIDALDEGVAHAADIQGPNAPVLVSVFLAGGIDSLSVLAPTTDSTYRRLRPRLALPEGAGSAFSEDERLRWHPAAAPLAQLHSEGRVTVMPAIGYDHPDQSHFNSRHFYEVGALSTRTDTGWMGRYLDRVGSADNPLQGLAFDGRMAPSLATARVPVAAIDSPADYDFWVRGVWGEVEEWMQSAFAELGRAHAGSRDAAIVHAASAAAQAGRLRDQLAPFRGDAGEAALTPPVAYPTAERSDFPKRLAGLAAMLAAGLPLHCVALTAPGEYDTHDNQEEDFESGLALTAQSLLAFQRDLEARGLADRVLVHVWSEFGRRAEENGGRGTDHGAAGLGLLIGNRASGRMVGEFPGLEQLDRDGNLRATSDFRGVYSGLLEQWLGHDAAAVIPNAARFARPQLVK
jgi:uncharacterized protein (DUF1501 family)